MGMVAGSMGTLRPLFVKLAVSITSRTPSTATSASSPPKVFTWPKRRGRRASTRVQGDSVLSTMKTTAMYEEAIDNGEGQDAVPLQTGLQSAESGARKSLMHESQMETVVFRQPEDCWRGIDNSSC